MFYTSLSCSGETKMWNTYNIAYAFPYEKIYMFFLLSCVVGVLLFSEGAVHLCGSLQGLLTGGESRQWGEQI